MVKLAKHEEKKKKFDADSIKKYAKLCSTYVGSDGMFKKNNIYVIEDKQHIPIREADPNEPGAIEKCFVKYEVLSKSSKRWSSGFHTITSHGDCKDILTSPNIIKDGKVVYGGDDTLLTYFDISSAEVKSAGSRLCGPFSSNVKNNREQKR